MYAPLTSLGPQVHLSAALVAMPWNKSCRYTANTGQGLWPACGVCCWTWPMDPEAGSPTESPRRDAELQPLGLTHTGQAFLKPVVQLLLQPSGCWDSYFNMFCFLSRESMNVKPKHLSVTRQQPFLAVWDSW